MVQYTSEVSGAHPWADGSVQEGDTKTINVQFTSNDGTTAGSAGGAICNQDWPATADGPMTVDGHLVINMNYMISTAYFGYGIGNIGTYTQPVISETGQVDIIGSKSYNGNNFVNFINTTFNSGILNVSNISMYSGDINSTIAGTGALNLTNMRLIVDNNSFLYAAVGSITGGQTVNMTGSDLSVYTALTDVTINMNGGGNYLALQPNNKISNVKINGFGQGDIIDFAYASGEDTWSYNPQTGDLTISNFTYSHTVNIGLGYDPAKFKQVPTKYPSMYGLTYTDPAPCFLAGSLIRTPYGECPVEALRDGDYIVCQKNGRDVACRIKAVVSGRTTVLPAGNLAPDEAGYCVRVRKDAFGEDLPKRDVLVTAEHCFFIKGVLIPVRMLVNGISIHYDTEILSFEYYHITLEEHGIIYVSDMPTESFFGRMACDRPVSRMRSAELLRQERDRLAAPVAVNREIVEPVYRAIEARALSLDSSVFRPAVPSEQPAEKPDIHLRTTAGAVLRPLRVAGRRFVFLVPQSIREVRLISAVARPCDTIGPFVDDRRYLGALVGDIQVYDSQSHRQLSYHLEEDGLAGWAPREAAHCRWTQGRGLLRLPETRVDAPLLITIDVLALAPDFEPREEETPMAEAV